MSSWVPRRGCTGTVTGVHTVPVSSIRFDRAIDPHVLRGPSTVTVQHLSKYSQTNHDHGIPVDKIQAGNTVRTRQATRAVRMKQKKKRPRREQNRVINPRPDAARKKATKTRRRHRERAIRGAQNSPRRSARVAPFFARYPPSCGLGSVSRPNLSLPAS
jgi:hypothetical protein